MEEEGKFKFDQSAHISTEYLNSFEIAAILRGNLTPMVNLIPTIAYADIDSQSRLFFVFRVPPQSMIKPPKTGDFAAVDEQYKKGFQIMQIAMQYILASTKKLQAHILELQKNTDLEKASHRKLKEFIQKQVSFLTPENEPKNRKKNWHH